MNNKQNQASLIWKHRRSISSWGDYFQKKGYNPKEIHSNEDADWHKVTKTILIINFFLNSKVNTADLENCAPDVDRARACKTSETRPIFRAHIFCILERKKSLDLQIYSQIGKKVKSYSEF